MPRIVNSTFKIQTGSECLNEKRYLLTWLFEEVFGQPFEIDIRENSDSTIISLPGSERSLSLKDHFFTAADSDWLSKETVPSFQTMTDQLNMFGTVDECPVFGIQTEEHDFAVTISETQIEFQVDLLGTLFVLVSRYEEGVLEEFDQHGRVKSEDCLLGKNDLCENAWGNEYIEIIWSAMQQLWPKLTRKQREFQLLPSHDIDYPSLFASRSIIQSTSFLVKDLVRRRSFEALGDFFRAPIGYVVGDFRKDPFDQIDWLMDQSEAHDLTSTFYYIPEATHAHDPGVNLDQPVVESQWRAIAARGHRLGMHPGYDTCLSEQRMATGFQRICDQLEKLKINQDSFGSRQHYLRWRTPTTARLLDQLGVEYDSSLGFAEKVGFRAGVCYEFPMYDIEKRQPMKIRQRPLVAMDATVIESYYMGLGYSPEGFDAFKNVADVCRKYRGDFTLLWHNTKLQTEEQRSFYCSLLTL